MFTITTTLSTPSVQDPPEVNSVVREDWLRLEWTGVLTRHQGSVTVTVLVLVQVADDQLTTA